MKNLLLISLIACATSTLQSFAQKCDFLIPRVEYLCSKSKNYTYIIPGQGVLKHIKCPKNKGGDIFILSSNMESLYGCLLNDKYNLGEGRMRVQSIGTEFFLVKTSSAVYKYDFKLHSWTTLKKKVTGWSTGNREEP